MVAELLFETVPDDWEVTTLGEVCARSGGSVQTGPFGSQLHASDYVPSGIPSIMPENLNEDRISAEGISYITPRDAERLRRYRVRTGDIVYSRRGDVTKRARVNEQNNGWLCGTGCLRVRFGSSEVAPRFAFYYMGHPIVKEWISRHAIGATLPNLNTSILSALPFLVPPPNEQTAIAKILGALDDKIELNRRMNETLEAMARAIFNSWFVDFDPVRAKAEGRQPFGMDAVTATLFPDSFEDSPLGKIPKGWRVGRLADFTVLNPETWTEKTAPNQIEYVDLSNAKWGRIDSTTRYLWKEAPSRAQRVLRPGDTIVGTVRPANGSYALISDEGVTGSTGFAVLRPQKPEFREIVYLAATAPDSIERLAQLADGAAYPAVRPDVVASTQLPRSPETVLHCFSRAVQPLLDKVAANHVVYTHGN